MRLGNTFINKTSDMFNKRSFSKTFLLILILANIVLKWSILQSYAFVDHEELCERRTIIKEIVENRNYNYLKNLNPRNTGGGSLAIFLSMPFYLLLGGYPSWMHLVGIIFSSLSILIIYLLLESHFNKTSAVIGSILLMFSPLTYTIYSLTSWGDHALSFFFQILIVYLFFEVWSRKKENARFFILLGFVSALAVFIFLNSLFPLLFCVGFWVLVNRDSLSIEKFTIFIVSFSIFIFLGLFYMSTLRVSITGDFLRLILTDTSIVNHSKFYDLLTFDLPFSFYFDRHKFYNYDINLNLAGIINSYIYYFIFLVSFSFALYKIYYSDKKAIRNKIIFFVLYFFFYSLVFSILSFDIMTGPIVHSHRYLIPLYFPIIVLLSFFITVLIDKRHRLKYIGLGLFLVILFISSSANVKLVNTENWDKPEVLYRKTCYEYIYKKTDFDCDSVSERLYCLEGRGWKSLHMSRNLTHSISECSEFGNLSHYCLEGVSKKLGMLGFDITLGTTTGNVIFWDDSLNDWKRFPNETCDIDFSLDMFNCDDLDERYKIFCYESFPMIWMECKKDPIQLCNNLGDPYQSFCYTGIGRSVFNLQETGISCPWENNTLCSYFYLGIGKEIAYLYSDETQFFAACDYFSSQEPNLINYCYNGYGWMVSRKSLGNKTYALSRCEEMGNYREPCRYGVLSYFDNQV